MVLKDDTLTLADAARLLGVSPATLRRRVARGVVSAERDQSNQLVFRRADLLRGERPAFSVFPPRSDVSAVAVLDAAAA